MFHIGILRWGLYHSKVYCSHSRCCSGYSVGIGPPSRQKPFLTVPILSQSAELFDCILAAQSRPRDPSGEEAWKRGNHTSCCDLAHYCAARLAWSKHLQLWWFTIITTNWTIVGLDDLAVLSWLLNSKAFDEKVGRQCRDSGFQIFSFSFDVFYRLRWW